MAAKQPTPEQARMFHMSQVGAPQCFDGCCLHNALNEIVALKKENIWMKRVLHGVPRTYWMKWVEGPWYATGDMDELQFFRTLAEEVLT